MTYKKSVAGCDFYNYVNALTLNGTVHFIVEDNNCYTYVIIYGNNPVLIKELTCVLFMFL